MLTMAVIFLNLAGIFEHFFIVFLFVIECLFLLDFALFIESIALDVHIYTYIYFLFFLINGNTTTLNFQFMVSQWTEPRDFSMKNVIEYVY